MEVNGGLSAFESPLNGRKETEMKNKSKSRDQNKQVESGVENVESSSSWGAKRMAGGQNFEQEWKRATQAD